MPGCQALAAMPVLAAPVPLSECIQLVHSSDVREALISGRCCRRLLALADALSEIKSVCVCGAKATMNLRVDAQGHAIAEGAQTEIGGNDRYIALCRRHFGEALAGAAVLEGGTKPD